MRKRNNLSPGKKKIGLKVDKDNIAKFRESLCDVLEREKPGQVFIYYPLDTKHPSDSEKLARYQEMDFFDSLLYFNQYASVHLVGFPLCILPSKDFFLFLEKYPGEFIESCQPCKEKLNCCGIPSVYLEKFGGNEFKPFTEKDYLLIGDWSKDDEKIKKFWDETEKHYKLIWEHYFKDIKGKILDVGAGIGVFLSFAPKRIIGVDINKEKINSPVRKIKNVDLRYGDIARLDFKSGYFSGVCCRFVLEHLSLEKARQALKEMKRVLKPGGKLFVLVAGKNEQKMWYSVGHETIFTRRKLEDLAKKISFKKYKIFNGALLRDYQGFQFDLDISREGIKEVALCLIAEK